MTEVILSCQNVCKSYQQGSESLQIIRNVSFDVERGQTIAIIGSSGAGKSTLLNLLGGLDQLSSGSIKVAGEELALLPESQLSYLRNTKLGFVYQSHHLLPEFSALENVAMPLLIRKIKRPDAYKKAADILEKVGLAQRLNHRPDSLSGGERQRVAIARALVGEPDCVLMDEPTGNLDEHTAAQIQALLHELNQQLKISFVIVTHDKTIAAQQQRILLLTEGNIQEQEVA